jgi:hypothetical protein
VALALGKLARQVSMRSAFGCNAATIGIISCPLDGEFAAAALGEFQPRRPLLRCRSRPGSAAGGVGPAGEVEKSVLIERPFLRRAARPGHVQALSDTARSSSPATRLRPGRWGVVSVEVV